MKKICRKLFIFILALSMILSSSVAAAADDELGDDIAIAEDGEASADVSAGEDQGDSPYSVYTARGVWPEAPTDLYSATVYMVETTTGVVLNANEEKTKRYPASTTKILTALVALENCSLSEMVTFSDNAVNLEDGASSIGAVAGEQMSMKDCLYGLLLPSGNDCAIAIAEHVSGSVSAFADLMNERARELGCSDSHFVNPHGLFDPDHYTTAYDMFLISQAAFNNSAFCEIVSHVTYTANPTNMYPGSRVFETTDYLIDSGSSYYNEYVVGGKTGYLVESGRCLVSMARKDGMNIITIVMYCPNYNGVFFDTLDLLNYAFSNFHIENVADTEKRFCYATEKAKVTLDTNGQVLIPVSVHVEDLSSDIVFTYSMNMNDFLSASEAAGITEEDGRHLYAVINYYLNNDRLGNINVIIDDNMKISKASFEEITFISIWWIIIGAGALVLIILIIVITVVVRKKAAARRRRAAARKRGAYNYSDRSGRGSRR